MDRKYNFYAGPATLPLPVLVQVREEIVDYHGAGLSLIETSHRSKEYDKVHTGASSVIRELFRVPDNYSILFLGGGATLQFGMVPLNLLQGKPFCDFTLTGQWSKKAYGDAKKIGNVNVVYDGSDNNFTGLPDPEDIRTSRDAAYLHITSNETVQGVQWHRWPETGSVPLVADMSSDIMSRPLPVDKFGLIYAGAQKNLGPAGVTLVIIRNDLVEEGQDTLPAYLRYRTHAEKDSLYNTPPVFSIYVLGLVMEWVKKSGGLSKMQALSTERAGLIYCAIDNSGGFYRCPVQETARSSMNIVFHLPSAELEARFIDEAGENDMIGLKGHRSLGGCRASVYNSMPVEGARALSEFMKEFARKNS